MRKHQCPTFGINLGPPLRLCTCKEDQRASLQMTTHMHLPVDRKPGDCKTLPPVRKPQSNPQPWPQSHHRVAAQPAAIPHSPGQRARGQETPGCLRKPELLIPNQTVNHRTVTLETDRHPPLTRLPPRTQQRRSWGEQERPTREAGHSHTDTQGGASPTPGRE